MRKRLPPHVARIERASGPQFRWEVVQEVDPSRPRWIKCDCRASAREVLADLRDYLNRKESK